VNLHADGSSIGTMRRRRRAGMATRRCHRKRWPRARPPPDDSTFAVPSDERHAGSPSGLKDQRKVLDPEDHRRTQPLDVTVDAPARETVQHLL